MSPRDLLAKVYDKVHDQIDETLDSAEEFANGFLEEFDASLDALMDQANDLLDSDTGNYLGINETFLSLVEAVYEAGEEIADRLAQLMQVWATLCAGIGEAGIDFLTGLFANSWTTWNRRSSFSEEVANDALGGSYKLEVVVESGS